MWVVLRLRNGDVSSDVPQANTATDGSDHQKTSSTILIDKENKVDEREYSLDDTKEPSSEQRGVGASDTNGLEDGWRVVVDGVDTRSVLPEEERASEEEAPLDLTA